MSLWCVLGHVPEDVMRLGRAVIYNIRSITHKGDALKADEEGDRFDAGTEGTWATRKHRSFLIHSVAAAAARALFSALATESRNRRARCLLPSAKPDRNFAAIHRPDISSRRIDAIRNTLLLAPLTAFARSRPRPHKIT